LAHTSPQARRLEKREVYFEEHRGSDYYAEQSASLDGSETRRCSTQWRQRFRRTLRKPIRERARANATAQNKRTVDGGTDDEHRLRTAASFTIYLLSAEVGFNRRPVSGVPASSRRIGRQKIAVRNRGLQPRMSAKMAKTWTA
jgi:hypothetical protein